MNERFRKLRKTLKFNQKNFGDKLGVSRDVISNIELGRVELKEHIIKLLISMFNVNEPWIRTGEGEMFVELSRDNELSIWAAELLISDNEFAKKFAHMLSKLNVEEWKVLERMAKLMLDENKKD